MALTAQTTFIAGNTKQILVGTDTNGNIVAAHVLANSSGIEIGTSANPVAINIATLPLPVAQSGQWYESPFLPITGATSGLTVSPAATTTPLALGTYTATTYRIRNPASSVSPVSWRLNTTTPGTAAVIAVPATSAGTGGSMGDKSIDPGAVEVFTLTAAQQSAWAAGTLYLSAITVTNGSATIFITPGTGGA